MHRARSLCLALVLTAFCAGLLGGCADKGEIKKRFWARHPKTLESVEKVWGAPVAVQDLGSGMERRFYDYQNPYTDLKYRYFVFFNDKVITAGLAHTAESSSPPPPPEVKDPEQADLSKAFYAKRPKTVEQIDKVWGEPVNVYPLEGGVEKRIYAFDNPYTDIKYRFFIAKDDKIVSAGLTNNAGEASLAAGPTCARLTVPELSQKYYEKSPLSLEEVQKRWGEPVVVQQMANGNQWRIYRYNQAYMDQIFTYRYFEVDPQGQVVGSGVTDMVQLCD